MRKDFKIKFTCFDGVVIELPELSLRMILTRLYCSYTRDICGLRGSAVSWLNYQFGVKKTYKFWQKAFKENKCFEALKIKSGIIDADDRKYPYFL